MARLEDYEDGALIRELLDREVKNATANRALDALEPELCGDGNRRIYRCRRCSNIICSDLPTDWVQHNALDFSNLCRVMKVEYTLNYFASIDTFQLEVMDCFDRGDIKRFGCQPQQLQETIDKAYDWVMGLSGDLRRS